jgi:hypothetical protein
MKIVLLLILISMSALGHANNRKPAIDPYFEIDRNTPPTKLPEQIYDYQPKSDIQKSKVENQSTDAMDLSKWSLFIAFSILPLASFFVTSSIKNIKSSLKNKNSIPSEQMPNNVVELPKKNGGDDKDNYKKAS